MLRLKSGELVKLIGEKDKLGKPYEIVTLLNLSIGLEIIVEHLIKNNKESR